MNTSSVRLSRTVASAGLSGSRGSSIPSTVSQRHECYDSPYLDPFAPGYEMGVTGRTPCRPSIVAAPRRAEAQTRQSCARSPNRCRGSERRLGFNPAPLLIHALILAIALLALVAIPIALAFDAHLLHAELVSVAIGVGLAGSDALVLQAHPAVAAIPVVLAFDALSVVTQLVRRTVVVGCASPGRRAVGQRREPHQTECATGGSLEQAATIGRRTHDAGNGIKPFRIHEFLRFAIPERWR